MGVTMLVVHCTRYPCSGSSKGGEGRRRYVVSRINTLLFSYTPH